KRQLTAGCLIDARISLLPQVGDLGLVAPIALQEAGQHRFQRQNVLHEPVVYISLGHAPLRGPPMDPVPVLRSSGLSYPSRAVKSQRPTKGNKPLWLFCPTHN